MRYDSADPDEKSDYEETSGTLTVLVQWAQLQDGDVRAALDGDADFPGQPLVAIVEIFVFSVNNLLELTDAEGDLEEKMPTTRLTMTCGERGRRVKSRWEAKDAHPRYETEGVFKLSREDVMNEELQVTMTIVEKEGAEIATHSLKVSDLYGAPMRRRMVQIDPEARPYLTMTLSAKMRFLDATGYRGICDQIDQINEE